MLANNDTKQELIDLYAEQIEVYKFLNTYLRQEVESLKQENSRYKEFVIKHHDCIPRELQTERR